MKKIPIFLLSILISSSMFASPQSASATIRENDTTWWTVEELLSFYEKVEAEEQAECGDDPGCQMEFDFSLYERGEKYRALNNLIESQFWVTSINPETETVKVLFFDEDMMLRHMGIKETLEIEYLFISWSEDWVGHFYFHNLDNPENNPIPGIHQVLNSEVTDVGAIIPWRETELPIVDSGIADNISGMFGYSIYAKDNKFNAQGTIDYSNCLSHPDYTYGAECKMYISGDQWVSYFPPRNEYVDEPTMEEPTVNEPITEELITEESIPVTEESAEESSENREENIEEEPLNETVVIESAAQESIKIKAPNTGRAACERTIEFPWWFLALLGVGDIAILWLFWPTKTHKNPKNLHKRS